MAAGGGRQVKKEVIDYLQARAEEPLAVATILATKGSTPRKAGTSMIVHPDGRLFGTIGGGRAEHRIRLNAIEAMEKGESFRRITVNLDDDVAVKEGMVCGGNMDIWIETQNIGRIEISQRIEREKRETGWHYNCRD